MKVEIWSEITCPWCGLGSHRLEASTRRDAIFRAYFGVARPIFGLDDLLGLADQIGVEREKTRRVLTEGRFGRQFQDDVDSAQRLGATGAQDTDTLLDVLRQVWEKTHPTVLVADNDAALCGPDGCAVPAASPDPHARRASACPGGHDTEEIRLCLLSPSSAPAPAWAWPSPVPSAAGASTSP